MIHPKPDDNGKPVYIKNPHQKYFCESFMRWTPKCEEGLSPISLHDVPLIPQEDWREGIDFREIGPKFREDPYLRTCAGMIVMEPDNFIWLVSPTNAWANYDYTFPKGTHDTGSLMETAVKETWEESGLLAQPTKFLLDMDRPTSRCRYYLGKRLAGCPSEMCWETQAVTLIHIDEAHTLLHTQVDLAILGYLKRSL